jgi:hypothetical protein
MMDLFKLHKHLMMEKKLKIENTKNQQIKKQSF